MDTPVVTTGAIGYKPGPGFNAPFRLEINDLIRDKIQFSLYIQALGKPPFPVLANAQLIH